MRSSAQTDAGREQLCFAWHLQAFDTAGAYVFAVNFCKTSTTRRAGRAVRPYADLENPAQKNEGTTVFDRVNAAGLSASGVFWFLLSCAALPDAGRGCGSFRWIRSCSPRRRPCRAWQGSAPAGSPWRSGRRPGPSGPFRCRCRPDRRRCHAPCSRALPQWYC